MKKIIQFIYLFVLCVFFHSTVVGQIHFCATDEMVAKSLKENPELLEGFLAEQQRLKALDEEAYSQGYPSQNKREPGCVKYIPIVFHIVHQNGSENISNSQVQDAVRILNEDFNEANSDLSSVVSAFKNITGNAGLQFVLATKDPNGNATTGIERYVSSETNVGDNGTIQQFIWPRNKYLNVIVVKNISNGAAGFTYLPGSIGASSDGIVILSHYVGSIGTGSAYRSRSLTHEVGHWFNLAHCWGYSNTPGLPTNCNDDDGVSDTPNSIGWQSCNLSGVSCGSLNNVQNFLEYSYCSKMFTDGQANRMQACYNGTIAERNSLWQPSNLSATGILNSSVALCAADFISSSPTNFVCQGGSLTFTDKSWSGLPTSYSWTFAGGTPSTSTAASPVIQYNTPGIYAVSLTVSNSTGNASVTKAGYVTVVKTPGAVGTPFYSEGFEGSTMPTDFIIVNENAGSATWTQAAIGATGSKSATIINSPNYIGHADELIGPSIDMTTLGGAPYLTFKLAHAQQTSTSNDNFMVYVSTNCGETWQLRMILKGAALSTAGVQSTPFTPTSSQWVTKTINLTGANFVNSPHLLFKFRFVSDGGNNIYIDDINIAGAVGSIDLFETDINYKVYPNPLENNSIISFNLSEKHTIDLSITDVLGRNVSKIINGELSTGEYKYSINENAILSPGIYYIRLSVDNRVFIKKLVVK